MDLRYVRTSHVRDLVLRQAHVLLWFSAALMNAHVLNEIRYKSKHFSPLRENFAITVMCHLPSSHIRNRVRRFAVITQLIKLPSWCHAYWKNKKRRTKLWPQRKKSNKRFNKKNRRNDIAKASHDSHTNIRSVRNEHVYFILEINIEKWNLFICVFISNVTINGCVVVKVSLLWHDDMYSWI